MMRSQTCSISFSSWLTTRSPIFRSFTSASRKFQIWLWVMGSNMVLISSAIKNRVLSPRALAMQNRCSSPPDSSPGYRLHQSRSIPSPLYKRSLIESSLPAEPPASARCGIHRLLRMLPDHLHRAVTAPRKRHIVHTDTSSRRCAGSLPGSDRASSYQSRSARQSPAGRYSPVPDSHPTAPLCCPRIFIADMFRFQSHRTFPPLPLIVLYEFSVYNMQRTLPPRTQTTGISPSHASRRSAQRGANGHPAGRSFT